MGKSVKNSSTSLARTTGNVGLPSSMMGKAVDRGRSRFAQCRVCDGLLLFIASVSLPHTLNSQS